MPRPPYLEPDMRRMATIWAGVLVAGSAWAQPPRYQVRPIEGPAGCETTVPQALDDSGRVVGGRCLWNPSATLPAPDVQHPEVFADSIARGVAAGHAVDED